MATTERTIRVLEELSKRTEPTRPLEIAEALHLEPMHVGKELVELAKAGYAVKIDKDKNTWAITDAGRAYLKSLPPKGTTPPSTGAPGREPQAPITGKPAESVASTTQETPPGIGLTIPSQLDIFRSDGELLAVGSKKGEIQLENIVKWVERMANLDDLDSIWNALTDLAIPDHIKKRWLKLYSQHLPKHKMTDELRERIESGEEEGKKIRTEPKAGEISPKPTRFMLIGNEIMGDPEGDLTFKQALEQRAQNLGAAPEQASSLATTIEAMKVGPEVATSLLTALMPLLNKAPDTSTSSLLTALMPLLNKPPDTTMSSLFQQQVQALQTQIVTLTDERHKAELEGLRAEFRSQRPPGADENIQRLTQQLDSLREELHKQQMALIQEQSRAQMEQLQNQIGRLELQISAVGQGKSTDSKIGLMSEIVTKGFGEVSGLRSDVKTMLPTILSRGATVKRRSEEEKGRFSQGLDKGIERATATKEMEEKLWPAEFKAS